MTNNVELLQRLKGALKHRFFPIVLKSDYPQHRDKDDNWHDLNRLSRSLAAYSLVGLCKIDDATAARALIDGPDDGGIDAIHFDRGGNRLVVVQSKYKESGAAPSQEEIQKTLNGIRDLQSRNFEKFNDTFRDRCDQIEAAMDEPGVQLFVIVVFPGNELGRHATDDLNTMAESQNRITDRFQWMTANLSKLDEWLLAEQVTSTVDATVRLEDWACVSQPRKAVYGRIKAIDLAKLVSDSSDDLFERNIRHYLGSVGVNQAIEHTVRRAPQDFFYLNNGLTAVAAKINQGMGDNTCCSFGLEKVSIVNGAQTAGSICSASLDDTPLSDDACLLITIIEIGEDAAELGDQITRARNHQTAVRSVDFAALDPRQERLRRELATFGVTYHYRPSQEARLSHNNAFTLEQAAVAMACLMRPLLTSVELDRMNPEQRRHSRHAVEYIVAAKKEVSLLWDQDGKLYRGLFPKNLSAIAMRRSVLVFDFIDDILEKTEKSETGYHRRMFFRHSRFFIMAVVANHLPSVLESKSPDLTEDDCNRLSRATNELSELVYSKASSFEGDKGYLAVFRNQTDLQPLADRVVEAASQANASSTNSQGNMPHGGTT